LDETGLIFDEREQGTGLHALLVGVSSYPYLQSGEKEKAETYGLGQLKSPARTVADIAQWLIKRKDRLGTPLRSCRLLASPSLAEQRNVPWLADSTPATMENMLKAAHAWRSDANSNNENATIFYFAGHGIQRTRGDSVLLLEDFLGGFTLLDRAVELSNIYNGMANPSFRDIAQTQIYVVDACRTNITKLRDFAAPSPVSVFDVEVGGMDNRAAPIFFASAAGHATYGSSTGGGASVFGTDFLNCLSGAAGDCVFIDSTRHWIVTIGSLARALSALTAQYNQAKGSGLRTLNVDKYTALDTVIHFLDQAPRVDCSIALEPYEAAEFTLIDFLNKAGAAAHPFTTPVTPNPICFDVEAGGYFLSAKVPSEKKPAFRDVEREIVTISPPFFKYHLRLM
jgi:hypothetical protein